MLEPTHTILQELIVCISFHLPFNYLILTDWNQSSWEWLHHRYWEILKPGFCFCFESHFSTFHFLGSMDRSDWGKNIETDHSFPFLASELHFWQHPLLSPPQFLSSRPTSRIPSHKRYCNIISSPPFQPQWFSLLLVSGLSMHLLQIPFTLPTIL